MKTIEVPCLVEDRGYLKFDSTELWFTVSRIDILKDDFRLRLDMDSGHKRQYYWKELNNIVFE